MGESLIYKRLHNKVFNYPIWAKYGTKEAWTYRSVLNSSTNGGNFSMDVSYFLGQISDLIITEDGFSWSSSRRWYLREWGEYVGVSRYDSIYGDYNIANGYNPVMYQYPIHLTVGTATIKAPRSYLYMPAFEITPCGVYSKRQGKTYIGLRYYILYPNRATVCDESNFITYIRAPEGTYPNDGLHSDGYWYILQE